MVKIADNPLYGIYVDSAKNRIYYRASGFWESVASVPDYLKHIEQTLEHVKPGFSMLVDIRQLEAHPKEVENLRKKAQQMAVKAGLKKSATVVPYDKISGTQFGFMTSDTGFPAGNFETRQQAENWLDKA